MASIDFITIIFEEILKIDSNLLYNYPTVPDQLIYLILIPHIILFLFLAGFGGVLSHEHKGMRYLVSIGAYIFIIYSGWYGMLAQLASTWFTIMIVFGLILFFISRIFPPITAQKFGKIGAAAGEKTFAFLGKGKAIEKLDREISYCNQEIARIRQHGQGSREGAQTSMILIAQYEQKKHELENERRKLEGSG
ncbi:MAG: hypothetical protein KJ697_04165 [Nanoarchaeota archaeon]|nr:hypothetical protein [Nanoarchaeota archaeon]